MNMSPFVMVVCIVAIVMAARVVTRWMNTRSGLDEDGKPIVAPAQAEQQRRMIEEMKRLSDRVAVLERILTDERQSRELDREIENLRK